MSAPSLKTNLRAHFSNVRKSLSAKRRQEAAACLISRFEELGLFEKNIGSFHTISGEIELFLLNEQLALRGRLFLPKREKESLQYYRVSNAARELKAFGKCLEPDPTLCKPIPTCDLDLILAPALAFDSEYYRIGYGKGFYDRLIEAHPNIHFMGIGFQEQMSARSLPRDPWDRPLSSLLLL